MEYKESRPPITINHLHHSAIIGASNQVLVQSKHDIWMHTRALFWIIILLLVLTVLQGGAVWPGWMYPTVKFDPGNAHHGIVHMFDEETGYRLQNNYQKKNFGYGDDGEGGPKYTSLSFHYGVHENHAHHPKQLERYLESHPHTRLIRRVSFLIFLLIPVLISYCIFLSIQVRTVTIYLGLAASIFAFAVNTASLFFRLHIISEHGFYVFSWSTFALFVVIIEMIMDIHTFISVYHIWDQMHLIAYLQHANADLVQDSISNMQQKNPHTLFATNNHKNKLNSWMGKLYEKITGNELVVSSKKE